MNISLEKLIGLVVSEVIKELNSLGINVDHDIKNLQSGIPKALQPKSFKFDFNGYKTPVLTEEKMLEVLKSEVKEIALPKGTMITPGARQIIKNQAIVIKSELKS